MTGGEIVEARECPRNEGTAVFRILHEYTEGRSTFTVGRIEIESTQISSTRDPFNWGIGGARSVTQEDFVVIYDIEGIRRVTFPRRHAMLEYYVPEVNPR